MVVVVVRARPRRTRPTKTARADADDEQARREGEPRIEPLWDDEAGEQERDEPEREDSSGMRDRHDQPEEDRMARLAPRSDEVAGDDRLPVTRRERVGRAPEHRHQQRDEDDADAQLVPGDERLEPARRARLGRGAAQRRSRSRPRTGLVGDSRGADVQRRAREDRTDRREARCSRSSSARRKTQSAPRRRR